MAQKVAFPYLRELQQTHRHARRRLDAVEQLLSCEDSALGKLDHPLHPAVDARVWPEAAQ